MAKEAKKFGTFGGVFTPSILTILGVIMYLRMGWVVGNSTVLGFVGIVLMAHIISITTGFSISSISTDKKIKAGGIYYLLSRSLGLPVGGAIGITIFIGTAISIALYVIGFAEVFCLQWGLEQSIDNYRWIGSIVLVVITIVAFISTSLAIKTQYIIMLLIGLSIFSVFLGGNGNLDLTAYPESLPEFEFSKLFAVFFPAVTGFTAGIAMSGDLKNPKKNIPTGTIASIITGLVVYMVLAFFIYYNVDGNALRADNYVLIKFALFPALVVAGIFGATLSSALGGILGAPRILQALSVDKITPRVFAKGSGASNEPRLAIIVTFVLAEIGILIGQLELIAEIVSMFYLAAYGFINLACFLESWASSDFRPSIKIPIWVPLLGFIFTFGVMLKLNAAAMIASLIINLLLFLWLSKKRLRVNSGDIWFSVWNTIIRTSLKKIENSENHERLWKPNVLMFSASSNYKSELIQFGKTISGNGGLISHFELHEQPEAEVLFPTSIQHHKADQLEDLGIFSREQICQNIPDAIENISSTYGFAGIEPNTVLMSWSAITSNANKFGALTERIHLLNRNLVILDYDLEKGFGKKEKIDVYVGKNSQNLLFVLNLLKSILNHPDWHRATIRILHISSDNLAKEEILNRINKILDNARITADIEIINNEFEDKPLHEIAATHSLTSDLIIIGLPSKDHSEQAYENYIKNTQELLATLGSTLVIKSTAQFKKSRIVPLRKTRSKNLELITELEEHLQLKWPELPSSAVNLQGNALTKFISDRYLSVLLNAASHIEKIFYADKNRNQLKKELQNLGNELGRQLVGNEEATKLYMELVPHKIKWDQEIPNQKVAKIKWIDALTLPSAKTAYFKETLYFTLNYQFLSDYKLMLNSLALLVFNMDQAAQLEDKKILIQEFKLRVSQKHQDHIDTLANHLQIANQHIVLEKEALLAKEPKYYWHYFDIYGNKWGENIPHLLTVKDNNISLKALLEDIHEDIDILIHQLFENIQIDSLIAPEHVSNYLSQTIKNLDLLRKKWSQKLPAKINFFSKESWDHFDEDQVRKIQLEDYYVSNNFSNAVGQYYENKLFRKIEGLQEELDRFNKSKIHLDAKLSSKGEAKDIEEVKEKIEAQRKQLKDHILQLFNDFDSFAKDLLNWNNISKSNSLKVIYKSKKSKLNQSLEHANELILSLIKKTKNKYNLKLKAKSDKESLNFAFSKSDTEIKLDFSKLNLQLRDNLSQLPYFYKKAFISDDYYSQRDFILREAIKDRLTDYINIGVISKKNINILIISEQGNGLSYFINQISRNFDKKDLKVIEANEILLLKSAEGIEQWKRHLIHSIEDKKVNVVGINKASYEIMKHLDSFNAIFHEQVQLPEPNIDFIGELLFKRHSESGLPLYIDNKKINNASNRMFQSLVDQIINASGNNLKSILYFFLVSAKYKLDKIEISLIDLPHFNFDFSKDEKVIVQHLMINKKLNRYTLKRLSLSYMENESFEKAFNNLIIFQLINQIKGDIYINPLIFKSIRKIK